MKIGDYVKYDNDLWEIISVDKVDNEPFYLLYCHTTDRSNVWKTISHLTKTDISQLTFEL